MSDVKINSIIEAYAALESEITTIKNTLKNKEAQREEMRTSLHQYLLHNKMKNASYTAGKINLRNDTFARITNLAAAYESAKEYGLPELFQARAKKSELEAFYRTYGRYPEGFNMDSETTLVVTLNKS